jgi:hypothetical protein
MTSSIQRHSLVLVLFVLAASAARADEAIERRVPDLERRIAELENRVRNQPAQVVTNQSEGLAMFLYGCFCALWAQNTNRNPWLWFFLGLFFSVITVIVLLAKHSNDRQRMRGKPAYGEFEA